MAAKIRILNPLGPQNYIRPKDAERLFVSKKRGIIEILDGKPVFRFTDEYYSNRQRWVDQEEMRADRDPKSLLSAGSMRIFGRSHSKKWPAPKSGPTPEDLHWRESVLLRDGYKCIFCGATERLEADHIKPKFLYPDLKHDIDNGRTLCHNCHARTETYGSKVRRIIDVSVTA